MEKLTETEPQPPVPDLPLVHLFRHNLWANLRLLDACAGLDEQQLAATVPGTYGNIYDTLRHLAGAEQSYLKHLTGRLPNPYLRREDRPDLTSLRPYLRQSGQGLIAVSTVVSPDDLVYLEWDEKRWPIPAGLILTQALNHATEHRSQVMTILTQQGIEPPDLSGWSYIEDHVTPAAVDAP